MVDPTDKFLTNSDEARFDRLVDGELSPAEYRALLASLDDEPGGWKRCALAFLEAQALGTELSGIRRSLPVAEALEHETRDADFAASGQPVGWRAPWRGQVPSLLAIAASFLLVFCVGVAAPRLWSIRRQEASSGGNLSRSSALASGNAPSGERADQSGPREIGNLRLVMEGLETEGRDAGHVPVYEVLGDVDQLLANDRPALAPELVELLRQRGYDVRREQRYFPAPLDDGRQIIVPVEGYQITPVGRRY